jgi:hypothetical protein
MPDTRGLQPAFREVIDWLLPQLAPYGFVLTSAVRSYAQQAKLYEEYLAHEGEPRPAGVRLYTVLPPGRSQHERGWAVDLARLNVHPQEDPLLAQLGAWWRQVGGVWGGPADPVHFEAPRAWTGRA